MLSAKVGRDDDTMSMLESKQSRRSKLMRTSGRGILERDEIRALLSDVGMRFAFESEAGESTTPSGSGAAFSGEWHVLSREVFGGQTVVETSVMRLNRLGSLVRCVTYSNDNPSKVGNVVMEFVPGSEILTKSGRACRLD